MELKEKSSLHLFCNTPALQYSRHHADLGFEYKGNMVNPPPFF